MSEKRFYKEYSESDRIVIHDRLTGMLVYDSEIHDGEDLCDEFNSVADEVTDAEHCHHQVLIWLNQQAAKVEELQKELSELKKEY